MNCQSSAAGIENCKFGDAAGREVRLFTLRSTAGSEISISTLGGTVTSLKVPDKEGRPGDVVLGFAGLEGYLRPQPYVGCLIGRCCNRIAGGRFSLADREYQLSKNDGPHHLHGGVRGFDKVVWEAQAVKDDEGPGLQLSYLSGDGEEGYPGNLQVRVFYRLTEDNRLVIDYTAETDAATLVNLTHHSYFNLGSTGDILDHLLTVQASAVTTVDDAGIPTGEIQRVAGTNLDLRRASAIRSILANAGGDLRQGGLDHNFVLDRPNEGLSLAASLYSPESGRRMRVYTTEPGLQVYTANLLDGNCVGRDGGTLGRYAGICFEAQHFPDSPNHAEFPSISLLPGETYRQTTIYCFDIEDKEEKR